MDSETKPAPPKQIKLTKVSAQVLRNTTQRLNQLSSAAKNAQDLFDVAAGMHQQHLVAFIENAGFKPAEFEGYGLWEEDGETYLRANSQQQQ